jgi:V8-like Glu-specific endopeptidase
MAPAASPFVAAAVRILVASALAFAGAACGRPAVAPLRGPTVASLAEGDHGAVWFGPNVADAGDLAGPGDSVVRITHSAHAKPGETGYEASTGCSGTLVGPDLVLTAHHCVLALDDEGLPTTEDVPPHRLTVGFGGAFLPWGRVNVRAVVAPNCGHEAGVADIALLVLAAPVRGVPTRALRLRAAPEEGERVHAIGFGDCVTRAVGRKRHEREAGPVTTVEGGAFRALASACPGDSGGPVVSPSRLDVVGVVAAKDVSGDGPLETHFTRLDVWRHLFAKARAVARKPSAHGNFTTDTGCAGEEG